MSTILKALRRLEEEKSRGASSRPLREEVASGPGEPPRRRLLWLPVLAMLVGAGLGASAWWFWPYERGGEPVREAAMPAAPAPATQVEETHVTRRVPPGFNDAAAEVEGQFHELAQAGPPDEVLGAPTPEDPLAAGGPPEDAFASAVEVVERPAPEPRIAPAAPGAPQERVIQDPVNLANEPPAVTARRARRATAAATRTSAPAPRIAAANQEPVAATQDPVTNPPPPPPTEQPAPRPRVEPPTPVEKPVAAVEPPKPKPAPEKVVAKKSAPAAVSPSSDADSSVRVKRTQWHPEPARRSADLDVSGKSASVHEGDVVGEYVVTEIRPSGVVLSRDGQRIERGIGK